MKIILVAIIAVCLIAIVAVIAIGTVGPTATPTPTPTPTATPTPTPTPTPKVQSDDRIGFIVNNIERTYIYPDELQGTVVLNTGYNFVVINLTLATVEGGRVRGIGRDSSLFDSAGHKYDDRGSTWKGWNFIDLTHLTSSAEAIAGLTSGIIVFALPEQSQPEELRLGYRFSLVWEEPMMYFIDINLQ